MFSSVALSTFTVSSSRHYYPFPELFDHPKLKLCTHLAKLSPSPSLLKLKLQWPFCAQLSAASAPFHEQFLLLLPSGVHMAGSSFSTGFRSKDTSSEQPCPGDSKLYLVAFPPFSPIRCFPDSTYH